MKRLFVQCGEVILEVGADRAAPGGAVTLELCGSWDHAGPCRWPHETSTSWDGNRGQVRVVFIATPEDEKQVRSLIERGLAAGRCVGPDGRESRWQASPSHPGVARDEEVRWGEDWNASPAL